MRTTSVPFHLLSVMVLFQEMSRGYHRRLLRRASMRSKSGHQPRPFLYKLVPTVGKIMESYYPEVLEKCDFIEKRLSERRRVVLLVPFIQVNTLETIVADLKEKKVGLSSTDRCLQTL